MEDGGAVVTQFAPLPPGFDVHVTYHQRRMISSQACAGAGAAVAGVTLLGYAVQIEGQGDSLFEGRPSLVAVSLSVAIVTALVAGLPGRLVRPMRVAAYGVSCGALMLWALLGVFSIGVPIFVAGLLVLLAGRELLRDTTDTVVAAAAGIATVAVIAGGLIHV